MADWWWYGSLDSSEATFKQLMIEGGNRLLKAINPGWPQRIVEVNEVNEGSGGLRSNFLQGSSGLMAVPYPAALPSTG